MNGEPDYARQARARVRESRNGATVATRNGAHRGDADESVRPGDHGYVEEEYHEDIPLVQLRAIVASQVERRETKWLWESYIPLRAITILDGDPGLGKSFIALDIAARWSSGRLMPPEIGMSEAGPGNVLVLNAEDDAGGTIRPRLEALGADLDRIMIVEEVVIDDHVRPVMLPQDLPLIEELAIRFKASLVVVDPLMAYLDGEVDSHKDSDVRRVSHGLKKMAERTNAAILEVRHLNKLTSVDNPVYRGGGSIGIIGAARSAFIVGKNPEDETQRVMCRTKGNLCAEPPALAYEIRAEGATARVVWIGEVEVSASDLVSRSKSAKADQEKARRDKDAETQVFTALDKADRERQGVSRRKARAKTRLGVDRFNQAVERLLDDGDLEETPITVASGKGGKVKREETGIRRKPTAVLPVGNG